MYRLSYAEIMEDAPDLGRERERAAFDRALGLLRAPRRADLRPVRSGTPRSDRSRICGTC
jgi:flagellar protein FlaF